MTKRTIPPKTCGYCHKPFEAKGDSNRKYCGRECSKRASWQTIDKAFWSHVDKTESCWLWTGRLDRDDYGIGHYQGKKFRAHRFSYELENGPLPRKTMPDHTCRVRNCVRPDHMEPVTHAENQKRGRSLYGMKIRQREQTHCKNGHPFNKKNTIISKTGCRNCRICVRAYAKNYYRENRLRLAFQAKQRYLNRRKALKTG